MDDRTGRYDTVDNCQTRNYLLHLIFIDNLPGVTIVVVILGKRLMIDEAKSYGLHFRVGLNTR